MFLHSGEGDFVIYMNWNTQKYVKIMTHSHGLHIQNYSCKFAGTSELPRI